VSIYKETANVSTCRINENTAALGGGVYIYESTGIVGDGIGPLPGNILNGDTTISDNTATGVEDYAGFGGGVYAEQGCPTGAYWLAVSYENGEGVKKDLAQARHWYWISRDRGDGDAAEALERLGTATMDEGR